MENILYLLKSQRKRKFKTIVKYFKRRLKNNAGRSNGTITAPRRGLLGRRKYIYIDRLRDLYPDVIGHVLHLAYYRYNKPNIAILCHPIGVTSLILAAKKVESGSLIKNYSKNPINPGDSAPLFNIAAGTLIHNISLRPHGIGKLSRAPGSSSLLVRHNPNSPLSVIKQKSGEIMAVHYYNTATLGVVSREGQALKDIKKAGTKRLMGKRPRTRPTAMNPVDHPLGGRTRGGYQSVNRKGQIVTNRKTKKRINNNIIYTLRQRKFIRY